MRGLRAALWAEALKARRSPIALFSAAGFSILPATAGLFMLIVKNPEQARALGIVGIKARLAAATADWPTFCLMLTQGAAIGGGIILAIVTAWVFGREFADHTAKEWLALPTPRGVIVGAKLALLAVWAPALTLLIFAEGLVIGSLIDLPGASPRLHAATLATLMGITLLDYLLMPFVALAASAGRGYLPAVGWMVLTTVLAQIAVVLGRGDWFPWSVPALYSGMAGPPGEQLGVHSFVAIILTFVIGVALTLHWWRTADHPR